MSEKEGFRVPGNDLVDEYKEVVNQGNTRRVRLICDERPLIDIPLRIGAPVAGTVTLGIPLTAAIAAAASLVKEYTIEIEKVKDED